MARTRPENLSRADQAAILDAVVNAREVLSYISDAARRGTRTEYLPSGGNVVEPVPFDFARAYRNLASAERYLGDLRRQLGHAEAAARIAGVVARATGAEVER